MRFLTIDTTTKITALALAEDGRLVGECFLHTSKTHSERLIPMIDSLMNSASWKLEDLELIGVVRGPGSFTGIRIGIATAQGLAEVLKIPMLGVVSLETLAWSGYGRSEDVIPILDARKNEWYTARYHWLEEDNRPLCIEAPKAISPKDWLNDLKLLNEPLLFAGDAVSKYRDLIREVLGEKGILLPEHISLPRGAYAVQAVWNKWINGVQGEEITPYYIRLSEAEVTWAKKEEERKKNNGHERNYEHFS